MTNHASGYAYNFQSSNQLFGCDEALPVTRTKEIPLVTAARLYELLRIDNSILIIPPFKIARHKSVYVNPLPLKIDINMWSAVMSRIVVVHNFLVEDCNPDLQECLAGIFFAGLINGQWEQPEDYPVECRTIEVIGVLDKRAGGIYPP
ncbi:MAG: hypothetical protein HGB33_09850 [Syntrophaceae bacterium]|nr:hypothetical protein [Syntrophaceae bacterium]